MNIDTEDNTPFRNNALGRESRKDGFHAMNVVHPTSYQTDWRSFVFAPFTQACEECDPICANCVNKDSEEPDLCMHGLSSRQTSSCSTCDPCLIAASNIRSGRSLQGTVEIGGADSQDARRTVRNASAASQQNCSRRSTPHLPILQRRAQ